MAASCASFAVSSKLAFSTTLPSTRRQNASPVALHSRTISFKKSFLSERPLLSRPRTTVSKGCYRRRGVEAKGNPIVETVIGTGKAGLKVATDLVPDAVPRPVARGGVLAVGALVTLSVVKSILSTAVSLVVVGGIAYAAFMYAKKSDSGSSSGSDGDSLDEAKRIMDKYK